jgi:aspartyl-tRNA(Asn)/glutamyl-tRNA(Gln) amidotransferase subunit C
MKVSSHEVAYVADLANLELTNQERTHMVQDLNSILDYIERLNQLDTSNVEPMAQVLLASIKGSGDDGMRSDIREALRKSLPHEEAVANAAQTDGTFFKVPKVIEK